MAAKAFGGARPIIVRTQNARPAPIIVRAPSRERIKKFARHAGKVVLQRARDEKHTMTAMMAGAALGFAERQNVQLPHIAALGTAGSYGVAAWLFSKWNKSRTAAHVATGLLSIAAYQHAKGGAVAGGTVLPLG